MASPNAIRTEALASIIAIGVFSPIAKASPNVLSKDDKVTATSATGICQGPTS